MVAITVILAAVIGTFVLGLGDQVGESTPNTQLAFDVGVEEIEEEEENDQLDSVTIEHRGGDRIASGDLRIDLRDADGTTFGTASDQFDSSFTVGDTQSADDLTAGNTSETDEITVRVIHTPTDSILRTTAFDFDDDVTHGEDLDLDFD